MLMHIIDKERNQMHKCVKAAHKDLAKLNWCRAGRVTCMSNEKCMESYFAGKYPLCAREKKCERSIRTCMVNRKCRSDIISCITKDKNCPAKNANEHDMTRIVGKVKKPKVKKIIFKKVVVKKPLKKIIVKKVVKKPKVIVVKKEM